MFFIMPATFGAGKIQEKDLATEKAVTEAVHMWQSTNSVGLILNNTLPWKGEAPTRLSKVLQLTLKISGFWRVIFENSPSKQNKNLV